MQQPGIVDRRSLLRTARPVAPADHWVRVRRPAMACTFEVTLSGEQAGDVTHALTAIEAAGRLEARLSLFRTDSLLSDLNSRAGSGPVRVVPDIWSLIATSRHVWEETSGAFDITTTPFSRCWGFLARRPFRPDPGALDEARALVGMHLVSLCASDRSVRFTRPGVSLNFGSIGKGFAVQRIADALRARGVRHALVSAAHSSIVALGGRDGGWAIDLSSRRARRRLLGRLRVRACAVATTGAAEQGFEIDGERYGHVIDPRSGMPACGMLSVTVVVDDGALADALATAFFVGGIDLARQYCQRHPRTLALLTRDDGGERVEIVGSHPGAIVEAV